MSRKTVGDWSFAPEPEWRTYIATHPLLFREKRRVEKGNIIGIDIHTFVPSVVAMEIDVNNS